MPPYVPPVREPEPREKAMDVEEHDTSDMTKTGVFKAWKRLTDKK
jgi:hypothetical protein